MMKRIIISLIILFIYSCQSSESEKNIAIVIHGGAGTILKENMTPELESAYLNKLEEAVKTGYDILNNGGSSQSAVEETIKIMEDSPLFNAGIGAALTNQATASLDASGKELCLYFVDIVKLVVARHCHVCKLVDDILCSSAIFEHCGATLGLPWAIFRPL